VTVIEACIITIDIITIYACDMRQNNICRMFLPCFCVGNWHIGLISKLRPTFYGQLLDQLSVASLSGPNVFLQCYSLLLLYFGQISSDDDDDENYHNRNVCSVHRGY